LEKAAKEAGAEVLTGHTLYSFSHETDAIVVRANSQSIRANLLIDCMGFGSPIVGARNVSTIKGYYIVHGCEVLLKDLLKPVGLDNVVINRHPAFFELFPTAKGTAHAALIMPSHQYKPDRSMSSELDFILRKSHYSKRIAHQPSEDRKAYFGIVPVGRLKTAALDRIVFFGEAGQANPAATATALTRMLLVYQELAESIGQCIKQNTLTKRHLTRSMPPYMTRMNRVFQELLFDSLLSFNSDDYRRLVQELKDYPSDVVNDMIFAKFMFRKARIAGIAAHALNPESVVGRHVLKSFARFLRPTH
jgi:2-polyprenyl-6-methoxyphenol hydroxylase-like FAD-dependent oxidoreductase